MRIDFGIKEENIKKSPFLNERIYFFEFGVQNLRDQEQHTDTKVYICVLKAKEREKTNSCPFVKINEVTARIVIAIRILPQAEGTMPPNTLQQLLIGTKSTK